MYRSSSCCPHWAAGGKLSSCRSEPDRPAFAAPANTTASLTWKWRGRQVRGQLRSLLPLSGPSSPDGRWTATTRRHLPQRVGLSVSMRGRSDRATRLVCDEVDHASNPDQCPSQGVSSRRAVRLGGRVILHEAREACDDRHLQKSRGRPKAIWCQSWLKPSSKA